MGYGFSTTISHANQALAIGNLKDLDRRRSLFLARTPLFAHQSQLKPLVVQ
jgi:hypothetical protein